MNFDPKIFSTIIILVGLLSMCRYDDLDQEVKRLNNVNDSLNIKIKECEINSLEKVPIQKTVKYYKGCFYVYSNGVWKLNYCDEI